MSDPFRIDGPAMVSFSGGRTSGLMLRRVVDAWGGTLPTDVHVLYANTGKERPETLDFIHAIETRWAIPIVWLEREREEGERARFRVVTYESASRNGEPFEALITERKFLPNPVTRYCTQELKIRTMKAWMMAQGYEHWTNVVGIRADEPRRVAKMRAADASKERWDVALPLAEAGITLRDVNAFWAAQPFDLRLRPWEGNCDLCFLKGAAKRRRIIEDRPDLAEWWIRQEQRVGATFRADSPSFAALLRNTQQQCNLFPASDADDLGDCICNEGNEEAA